MNSNEWRELRGRFVQAIENTPAGAYSLEAARMAPEVFQYSDQAELSGTILTRAWIDPTMTEDWLHAERLETTLLFLDLEEEDRVKAGVLEPVEGM